MTKYDYYLLIGVLVIISPCPLPNSLSTATTSMRTTIYVYVYVIARYSGYISRVVGIVAVNRLNAKCNYRCCLRNAVANSQDAHGIESFVGGVDKL